jgi:hypothetical protein
MCPDLILQAPPRALERVVNREVEVEKALARCRRPCDRDFPPVRQRHMDVDLVVAARPVMGARCLHHDAKGGYAPVGSSMCAMRSKTRARDSGIGSIPWKSTCGTFPSATP